MSDVPDNPRAAKLPEPCAETLGFAHEVVHGFSVLSTTIEDAIAIVQRPLYEYVDRDMEDLREYLETIRHEICVQHYEAWNWLSHHVPDFAGGLQRPLIRTISPIDLLRSMLRGYQVQGALRGIEIREDAARSEPMPAIQLEENTVRRAFHNVLSNAVKYSYKTIASVTQRFIRIRHNKYDPEGQLWAIHVQNFGIGIESDEFARLFEPGYRGRLARAENTFGAGLGLGEVLACMQRHRGRFVIKSDRQHDSTYLTTATLVFPLVTNIRNEYPNARIVD